MQQLNLIHLKNYPIAKQLALEEHLLRHDERQWCLINQGSPPAIVLGIAGKEEDFVCPLKLSEKPIPVFKRFSGGGTVIVDEKTLFISFICPKKNHPFAPYPEPILRWAEGIYKEGFGLDAFHLKENDFVIGEKKCGGNAKYIRKDNWLIHTSFLWDFDETNMDYLLFPKKTPAYRAGRKHTDFLCKLKDYFPSQEMLVRQFKNSLKNRFEVIEDLDLVMS